MKPLKLKFIEIFLLLVICFTKEIVSEGKLQQQQQKQPRKTYVVHMDKGSMPEEFDDHVKWYHESLRSASDSASMLYMYQEVIHGFSTRLTEKEAELLEKQPGILSVLPEQKYELHTTHTPQFLGLAQSNSSLLPASGSMSEVIIGVLDTGVWPEHRSFDDSGLGPVPSGWKGECETGRGFNSSSCNRKLIGARFFSQGYEAAIGPVDESMESKSPRDDDGHGTHTASTAAGSAVPHASMFGFAPGTAQGMAPHARLAIYKVCWLGGCFSSDILAAMERAVKDGVNILSMSLGGGLSEYYMDIVAIGAFTAMANGVLVSCSAGNSGPSPESLSNVAPWITTVGAGTLDRDFPASITLGNSKQYHGVSLYNGKPLPVKMVPLTYDANATTAANLCMPGTLDRSKVAGKIVVCDRGGNARAQKGQVVKEAGGVGIILANTEAYGEELVADAHVLPSASVGQKTGEEIKRFIHSESNPTGIIGQGGTHLGVEPSPVVAAFSSRGPNPLTPEILKPDIIAPGVNILAGWTGRASPTGLDFDKRRVDFNIISGTSMSCPHVSGLAALIKAAHPEWSPAAIRSALMTTAYTAYKNGAPILDISTEQPATPLDYGAGHANLMAALEPGLVYDTTVDAYLGFLCALNYTKAQIKRATNRVFTCDKQKTLSDFNYPSFSVPLETASGRSGANGVSGTLKYSRTLTNVGNKGTYKVSVSSQTQAVKISVEPAILTFSQLYEKKSYTVTFTARSMPSGTTSFGRLEWSDGKHMVRSPIVFSWT